MLFRLSAIAVALLGAACVALSVQGFGVGALVSGQDRQHPLVLRLAELLELPALNLEGLLEGLCALRVSSLASFLILTHRVAMRSEAALVGVAEVLLLSLQLL